MGGGSLVGSLLVPVLTYGNETMILKEKERPRIRTIQINNLRGLLGIRRMDKVSKARIIKLCGVTKSMNDEGSPIVRQLQRLENDRIAKRVYVGKWGSSRSVGRTAEEVNCYHEGLLEKKWSRCQARK